IAAFGAAGSADTLSSPGGNPGITGPVTLDGGTLNVGASGVLGTSNLNIIAGSLNATATATLPNSFSIANTATTGVITFGGTGLLTFNGAGSITGANALTFSNTGGVVFNGVISEGSAGSSLTVAGASPITFNAANTFTGGLTLAAGATNTITLGNNAA